ncbi:MAG: SHD1 domain-containing protein [Pirellulaceae bacterium]
MKNRGVQAIICGVVAIGAAILLACGGTGGGRDTGGSRDARNGAEVSDNPAAPQWPYQFVDSKTEQSGYRNVMDLYAYAGVLDLSILKAFCADRKRSSRAPAFYYVVVFDDPKHAKFPSSPFTAAYGLEEDALRHIRAMYAYNKLNGHSQLTYYAPNAWDGKATVVAIGDDIVTEHPPVDGQSRARDEVSPERSNEAEGTQGSSEFRDWTDATGEFRIRAKFISFANGTVRLEKSDGNIVAVPMERLCDDDQTFIKRKFYK